MVVQISRKIDIPVEVISLCVPFNARCQWCTQHTYFSIFYTFCNETAIINFFLSALLNGDICNASQLLFSWLQPANVTGNQYKATFAIVALFSLDMKFSDLPSKDVTLLNILP